MYIEKYSIADAVPTKKSNPENMTSEELRKVLAPLRHQKDKAIKKRMVYQYIIFSG